MVHTAVGWVDTRWWYCVGQFGWYYGHLGQVGGSLLGLFD